MKSFLTLAAALLPAMAISANAAPDSPKPVPNTVLGRTMTDIDGKPVKLTDYLGKVVLIVNVASRCGFTPQYADLQKLYDTYGAQGFVILAFPANDFMGQEPGTNEEIKKFCTLRYNVTFPVFAKIHVTGNAKDPLYKFLTEKKTNPQFSGSIKWNFTKFLVSKKGEVVGRFGPTTKPSDAKVVTAIETELRR